MRQDPIEPSVLSRWRIMLDRIEKAGDEGLWIVVDDSSQEWRDLKEMAQRGVAFPCGLRSGGKESAWFAYDNARRKLDRLLQE